MTTSIGHMPQPIMGGIHADTLQTIRESKDRDHIGGLISRIFEKIKDWVSGTHVYEAKQCLHDILSEQSSDLQKFTSFSKLHQLAGAGYQDRFSMERAADGKFSLIIHLDEPTVLAEVNAKASFYKESELVLNQERILSLLREDAAIPPTDGQFRKDIHRGDGKTIMINGQEVAKSALHGGSAESNVGYTVENFMALAKEQGFNDAEIQTVEILANQRSIGILTASGPADGIKVITLNGGKIAETIRLSRNADGEAVLTMTQDFDYFESRNCTTLQNFYATEALLHEMYSESPHLAARAGSVALDIVISPSGEVVSSHGTIAVSEFVDPYAPEPNIDHLS